MSGFAVYNSPNMLSLNNLSKSYAQRVLFSHVTFNIDVRDRMALLGANGSGKSTLLGIVAGEVSSDEGSITRRKGLTVGYLKQESCNSSQQCLLSEVTSAAATVNTLEHRIGIVQDALSGNPDADTQAQLMVELGDLQHRFEAAHGYNVEQEAGVILCGLGFRESDFDRPMSDFSGGWRMRAELAKILLQNPDLLLLDEPTNHLDLETQIWFEEYVKAYQGAVLLTSHDRAFLNRVVNRVLALDHSKLSVYTGNYDDYVEARQQEMEILEATARRQSLKIGQEEHFINRFRYKATKASQVQSRIKKLDKIKRVEVPRLARKISFHFPPPPHSGTDIIMLSHVQKSYGENVVYGDLNLQLRRGDRVAIVGPNGAGKTTLLKILAGVLPFDGGERKLGHAVTHAYYAQHQLELLEPNNTVLAELRTAAPSGIEDMALRTILGGFLFSGDDVFKQVSVLSGGEKARLALAKMLTQPANFLLMDEPTNHLDIASREMLSDALEAYSGTLCFITHDRTLIRQIATTIIDVNGGQISVFPGDYDTYQYHKEMLAEESFQAVSSAPQLTASVSNSRQKRAMSGELRNDYYAKSTPLNKRIEKLEADLANVEAEIKYMEDCFARPEHYEDSQEVVGSIEHHRELKARAGELTAEWEKLATEAESLREAFETALNRLDSGGQ
ncbi:MAG: ABC-F family ATP-binding cassette domain-containing protein [Dehalococcoidia bacterium]|nr:ABC-F family ATP-binding cassette domain-containing protein [Dehalococcoidia bacterium]